MACSTEIARVYALAHHIYKNKMWSYEEFTKYKEFFYNYSKYEYQRALPIAQKLTTAYNGGFFYAPLKTEPALH